MRQAFHFLSQAAVNWRQTGAIAPSSRRLARTMADAVGEAPSGSVIIELGPGSGCVTEALHNRFPHCRVIAIENNASFAERLAARMPSVPIIYGCASALSAHLDHTGLTSKEVVAVVSGLPLLSLDPVLVNSILSSVRQVLQPGGRFIQFTYSERAFSNRLTPVVKLGQNDPHA
ncbi:MAG: methyltransferase domain-containing protein, partial [Planctomycetota bacterium]